MSRPSTSKASGSEAPTKPRGKGAGGGGGGGGGKRGGKPPASPPDVPPPSEETSLVTEARTRYLNYALSVITSRALPDVRDGLKPVQRRILFTMRKDLGLTPDGRYRKSATVVGAVLGSYHPHGDSSVYDAMVRMAQSWVMRLPLIDGQGNFGSSDGDEAAAYRYTEAKLLPAAIELLSELDKRTVSWRPNFDGQKSEPVVLPARFPNLLVNGAQGIAVGMATSIPPHNLSEVVDACIAQIEAGAGVLPTRTLLKYVKGPDVPTGGLLMASKSELVNVYESGSGTFKLRGDWKLEEKKGGAPTIILTSLPYGVVRGALIEQIAQVILQRKLGALVDVRDESTSEVRVVLEMKKGSDPNLVVAYLFKNTALQTTIGVNLTCLVPAAPPITMQGPDGEPLTPEESLPAVPERLSLGQMIRHFLDFRMLTVERRLKYDLWLVRRRIHTLEGFETVFDALDETIKIIRKSEGKADAAAKLMARFKLSEEQVDAILELKLYRLAKLEILVIQKELADKRGEASALETLLKSESKRWAIIKTELTEIKTQYPDKRRLKIAGQADEQEYSAEDFIVAEDAHVLLSQQGWIKRQREVKDLSATRVREGDYILSVVAGSTKTTIAFFSNLGACYVTRIHDVPATTGYGEPVQKFFKMEDGERIIAALSFDPRILDVPAPVEGGEPQPPFAVAVTRQGLAFRFSLSAHKEASTRAGRKYGRLNEGDEVVMVAVTGPKDGVLAATSDGHALGVPVGELALLSGVGKGSMLMKVDDDARVLGAVIAIGGNDSIVVETGKGREMSITYKSVLGKRAQAGSALIRRDGFARMVPQPPTIPSLEVT